MVESGVWWGILVISHLIRSGIEKASQDSLTSDISSLRVEVHRARELIAGYNEVLEACENSSYWLKWANSCLCWIVLLLLCGIGWTLIWIFFCRDGSTPRAIAAEVANTPEPLPLVVTPARTGPLKPSTLGKGKPAQ